MTNPANKIAIGRELLDTQKILKDHLKIGFGEKVADLGCGAMGFFILQAAKLIGDQGTAYAVDIIKEVLSSVEGRARVEGLLNVKIVWSDLEKYGATNIPTESLDAALLVNTLFQTKNRLEVIKEAYRLIKPKGRLLIVEWKKITSPFGPSLHLRLASEEVKEMANSLGLKLEKEFAAGNYHYGLIFVK